MGVEGWGGGREPMDRGMAAAPRTCPPSISVGLGRVTRHARDNSKNLRGCAWWGCVHGAGPRRDGAAAGSRVRARGLGGEELLVLGGTLRELRSSRQDAPPTRGLDQTGETCGMAV